MQGLRKDFYSSAKSFSPVLLDKFKDKNSGVCRATTDALVNMHKCVPDSRLSECGAKLVKFTHWCTFFLQQHFVTAPRWSQYREKSSR